MIEITIPRRLGHGLSNSEAHPGKFQDHSFERENSASKRKATANVEPVRDLADEVDVETETEKTLKELEIKRVRIVGFQAARRTGQRTHICFKCGFPIATYGKLVRFPELRNSMVVETQKAVESLNESSYLRAIRLFMKGM